MPIVVYFDNSNDYSEFIHLLNFIDDKCVVDIVTD